MINSHRPQKKLMRALLSFNQNLAPSFQLHKYLRAAILYPTAFSIFTTSSWFSCFIVVTKKYKPALKSKKVSAWYCLSWLGDRSRLPSWSSIWDGLKYSVFHTHTSCPSYLNFQAGRALGLTAFSSVKRKWRFVILIIWKMNNKKVWASSSIFYKNIQKHKKSIKK